MNFLYPSETQTPAGEGESSSQRHNLDISLLARHIEHMQRICRASLEDLPQSRQRRQVTPFRGFGSGTLLRIRAEDGGLYEYIQFTKNHSSVL